MIFQWYLFVLLAFIATFAPVLGLVYESTEYEQVHKKYTWLPVLMLIIPMVLLAANRINLHFADTSAYVNWFRSFPSTLLELPKYLQTVQKDKGFTVFSTIIKSIIGNNVELYFGIIAFICLISIAYGFKNLSCNFAMSMFLFIASGEYLQWCYNGIRQFIPVAILFAASVMLLKRRYVLYILLIVLLSTIHGTALFLIPMIFVVKGDAWNFKTFILSTIIIVAIVYVDHFTGLVTYFMENSVYNNEVDQFLYSKGTNILRVLVFAIPPLLSLIFKKQIDAENNDLLNLSVNMSIVSMDIYIVSAFTSGLFIGRLPIYFSLYNYILIPWIVEHVFQKESRFFAYLIIIIAYMLFYYYQTSITWGL